MIWMIFFFVLYHGVNIFLGWQNKQMVQKRINHKDLRQTEHFWWGLMYGALCAPWYWVYGLWFALSLIPLHLSIFSVAYNRFRGLDGFNLSKTSTSITNKILLKMGCKSMEGIFVISEILAIVLLVISIIVKLKLQK